MRRLLVIPLSFLLVACTTPASHLTLEQSAFGATYTVSVGSTLALTLVNSNPVPGSSLSWSIISSDPLRLLPSPAGISSPAISSLAAPFPTFGDSTVTATFVARLVGQAKIQATGLRACQAMPKTNCPDLHGVITVNITPA